MKTMLLAQSFPPPPGAGSVQYIANIFSALPPQSAVIVTCNTEPVQAKEFDAKFPQRIIRIPFLPHVTDGYKASRLARAFRYLLWPLAAGWFIVHEKPQVIHFAEYNAACIAGLAAKWFFRIPFVLYTYAEEITYITCQPHHLRLLRLLLRNADAIVTVSDYTIGVLQELGASPARIHKVLPAVGCDKSITSLGDLESLRIKYSIQSCRILLTVGRLIERKGHATVIEAFPLILQTFPTVRYVIAGTGPEESRLKKAVEEARLQEYVLFLGWVDDSELASWYEICEVFVMPHRELPGIRDTEGCPTVFLEAGAHGKPVIGGRDGGVADAILDNQTGFIIDGKDATRLAQCACGLLSSPELAARMGAAGRAYATMLGPESRAAAIQEINSRLLEHSGTAAKD